MTVHLLGRLEVDGGVRVHTLCGSTPQYGDQVVACLSPVFSGWCWTCRNMWFDAREFEHQQFAQWRKGKREQETKDRAAEAARRLDGSYGT